MKYEVDNFTAVLPVTCNADCGFCPEKEIPNELKASKDDYLYNLVDAINQTAHLGYDHVSISGGEPTLDPRLLGQAIRTIITNTPIKKVGLTTNGQFLESTSKINKFVEAAFDESGVPLIDFINISRHAVRTEENNAIMGVNYSHTMRDVLAFRAMVPETVSFHINVVVQEFRELDRMFEEFKAVSNILAANAIDIVFRTDYDWQEESDEIIPDELITKFNSHFGAVMQISGCPTCATYRSISHSNVYIKGATFEPTDHEETIRELVFHQDGNLYLDWVRNKPYISEEQKKIDYLEELLGSQTVLTEFSGLITPEPKQVSIAGTIPELSIPVKNVASNSWDENELIMGSCGYRIVTRESTCDFGQNNFRSCGFGGCGY